MRTRLTETLGIEHPVMLAGMGGVSYSALTAAVSDAGGFGCLGASVMSTGQMIAEMAAVRSQTDKPFGVDLLLPSNYMGGAASGEMPRDPRDLIPKETSEGLKKIAGDLGIEWHEAPRPAATAVRCHSAYCATTPSSSTTSSASNVPLA